MPFRSSRLQNHPDRVRVGHIFQRWRVLLFLRFICLLPGRIIPILYLVVLLPWAIIRIATKLLCCLTCETYGDAEFASATWVNNEIGAIVVRFQSAIGGQKWLSYWRLYFIFTEFPLDAINDYVEAWRIKQDFNHKLLLFIDNSHCIEVPCSDRFDDKALLEHVRDFYCMSRTIGGAFEFFGAKSSLRIDVVELEHGLAAGDPYGEPLALGRYGPYNRQVRDFLNPEHLTASSIVQKLATDDVLTTGTPTRALNIVRGWDPHAVSFVILIPVVLSLLVSVLWSALWARLSSDGVQVSTQTGFTIGSYVVTSGALIIALVAFLDTKVHSKTI